MAIEKTGNQVGETPGGGKYSTNMVAARPSAWHRQSSAAGPRRRGRAGSHGGAPGIPHKLHSAFRRRNPACGSRTRNRCGRMEPERVHGPPPTTAAPPPCHPSGGARPRGRAGRPPSASEEDRPRIRTRARTRSRARARARTRARVNGRGTRKTSRPSPLSPRTSAAELQAGTKPPPSRSLPHTLSRLAVGLRARCSFLRRPLLGGGGDAGVCGSGDGDATASCQPPTRGFDGAADRRDHLEESTRRPLAERAR